jgi:hypothetical protein
MFPERWSSDQPLFYDLGVADAVPNKELRRLHSLDRNDYVPGRPRMTEFRRSLRYHQARWREAKGHPAGTQPIVPKVALSRARSGSRLPLAYAQETGANFLTPRAFAANTDQSVRSDLCLTEADIAFYGGAFMVGNLRVLDHFRLVPQARASLRLSGAVRELQSHLSGVELMRTAMRTNAVHERPNRRFSGLVRTA